MVIDTEYYEVLSLGRNELKRDMVNVKVGIAWQERHPEIEVRGLFGKTAGNKQSFIEQA